MILKYFVQDYRWRGKCICCLNWINEDMKYNLNNSLDWISDLKYGLEWFRTRCDINLNLDWLIFPNSTFYFIQTPMSHTIHMCGLRQCKYQAHLLPYTCLTEISVQQTLAAIQPPYHLLLCRSKQKYSSNLSPS